VLIIGTRKRQGHIYHWTIAERTAGDKAAGRLTVWLN